MYSHWKAAWKLICKWISALMKSSNGEGACFCKIDCEENHFIWTAYSQGRKQLERIIKIRIAFV